ncbi:MAG: family N-acetyltransferase [Microbacteriaceae bacterium]|nr:family N-acetyltransferase [Microbacteriaceae bacterium]
MNDFTISEIIVPASIDAPDAADFVAMVDLGNALMTGTIGTEDDVYDAAEQLQWWQTQQYMKRRGLLALRDGQLLGYAVCEWHDEQDSPAAWLTVEVAEGARKRGVGSALYDGIVRMAQDAGKTAMQLYVMHNADTSGERLDSPTGFGSVAIDDPGTRFLLARKFAFMQVERLSRLPLPAASSEFLATALAAAGGDYRTITWTGVTPDEWLGDIAVLRSAMATDAPWAGIQPDESDWDADRVKYRDQSEISETRTLLSSAMQHVPTGGLVGFTQLSVPVEKSRSVSQYDTLVLQGHRGHRLGMLLKAANLIALEELWPGHPSVSSYNAEENRPMLSVNEQLGFVPIGYVGCWRLDLPSPPAGL